MEAGGDRGSARSLLRRMDWVDVVAHLSGGRYALVGFMAVPRSYSFGALALRPRLINAQPAV
jgi:hypothetical protein